MGAILNAWWPLLAAVTFIQIGNGVAGLLISLKTEAVQMSPGVGGAVIAAFYLGSAVGALAPPRVILAFGHTVSFAAFICVSGLSVLGYVVAEEPVSLGILRFVQGFGLSAMFATSESWLNRATTDGQRARVFAVYIMVQLLGLFGGQLVLRLEGLSAMIFFGLAGVLTLGSALILAAGRLAEPPYSEPQMLSPWRVLARAPEGTMGLVIAGFFWAAVMGIGPVYAGRMALSTGDIAIFMALAILGGALAQFPLGALADRVGRARVIAGMVVAAGLIAAAALWVEPGGRDALWIIAGLFGAMTFPIYAIAAPLANEALDEGERTAASAAMVLFFCMGATVAPMCLTQIMAAFGPAGFFALGALILAAYAALLARRVS